MESENHEDFDIVVICLRYVFYKIFCWISVVHGRMPDLLTVQLGYLRDVNVLCQVPLSLPDGSSGMQNQFNKP